MKKLGLVFLALALVAGGAFAADVSGDVFGYVYVLQGDSNDNSEVTSTGNMSRLRLNFSGQNEGKTLGMAMRLNANGLGFSDGIIDTEKNTKPVNFSLTGYAWWRPNSVVKMGLGYQPGDWFGGREGVFNAMWGGANDVQVADNGQNSGNLRLGDGKIGTDRVVTGGWDKWGVGVELTPPVVEGLKVNIGIPYITNSGNRLDSASIGQLLPADQNTTMMGVTNSVRATDMYSNIFYQAVYDIGSLKSWVALTYRPDKWTPSANTVDRGQIYATVNSKIVDNLEFTLSFGYRLPGKVDVAEIDRTDSTNIVVSEKKSETTNHATAAGIAAVYKNGDLGVNFRTVASFGGKQWGNNPDFLQKIATETGKPDGFSYYYDKNNKPTDNPLRIMVDLVPNYGLTDTIRAYLALGITSVGETKTEGDAPNIPSSFGWVVNPYISLAVSGSVSLYAGFRVQSNGGYNSDGSGRYKKGDDDDRTNPKNGRDPIVNWAIPIGLKASF